MPIAPMVARFARVTPAYAECDGLRVDDAWHDKDGNLVLGVTEVGEIDRAPAAAKTRSLMLDHPSWQRRVAFSPTATVKFARINDLTRRNDELANFAAPMAVTKWAAGDKKGARLLVDTALLHGTSDPALWFVSALLHHLDGDAELVRRDLSRLARIEDRGSRLFENPARAYRLRIIEKVQNVPRKELNEFLEQSFLDSWGGKAPISLVEPKMEGTEKP
jgi:hypothetical protein